MRDAVASVARWGLLVVVAASMLGYLAHGLQSRDAHPVGSAGAADGSQPLDPELRRTVDAVDALFADRWRETDLQPAPAASWETVCRRLALALVGSGLSLEEMRQLQRLPEPQRVAACRERLLADRRFADYWAERLARTFVGSDPGRPLVFRRRRFVAWLSESLAQNRPYDQLVRDLISGEGLMTDRPQVNFLTATITGEGNSHPDPIRLAARTSRAFLAMRVDCLQCHDDFLGNVTLGTAADPRSGTQHDFHALAAFFSSARMNGLQGIRNRSHLYEYPFLGDDQPQEVPPSVPYSPELCEGSSGAARDRLAVWITHPQNHQAARAAVNRVWALLCGRPLSEPVDDIPLYGPSPTGLDRLAEDFVEGGWDLRRLIRIITSTQVYRLDSRSPRPIDQRHEDAWALFPVTPLRPEQVAGAVFQAGHVKTLDRSRSLLVQLQIWGDTRDFVRRYGDLGEDFFERQPVTIPQRLLMLNGSLVGKQTQTNPVLNACTHIHMFSPDAASAILTTYLAVLNRPPTDTEAQHFLNRMRSATSRQRVIQDIYWALINSTEMVWNH